MAYTEDFDDTKKVFPATGGGTTTAATTGESTEKMTAEEFIQAIKKGRRDFSGVDFSHQKFDGLNLGVDELPSYCISQCNFTGANFTHTNLVNISFHNCNFTGANFTHTNLVNISFLNCNFTGANLKCTNISHGVFDKNCDFTGADFSQATISSSIFDTGKFDKAIFEGLNLLSGVEFNAISENSNITQEIKVIIFNQNRHKESNNSKDYCVLM